MCLCTIPYVSYVTVLLSYNFIVQRKELLTKLLSKISENTDGCAEQYRCASAL